MNAKWAIVAIVVVALGIALWASDRITWEGERTIHTVHCEQGNWEGLSCTGKMVAGDRYRFRASTSKQEVLYWIVASSQPYGKFSRCQVKDRGNWECDDAADQPPTITRTMVNGRPKREDGPHSVPFHAVPKWVWWVLHSGIHIYSKAGY